MLKSLLDFASSSLRRHTNETRDEVFVVEKFDNELKENMRALRLLTNIADQLLGRGMAASDVVYLALGIAKTYCSRKVHVDIIHTLITVSLDRGVDREPLTIVRTVSNHNSDYRRIQLLEDLAREIKTGNIPIDVAEQRLDKITSLPRLYSRWVVHLASGGLSAGVVMLYSHNPTVWILALLMGVLVSFTLYRMTKMGLPSFYSQIFAGLVITVIAALVSLAASNEKISFLGSMDPTLLIIGGIVLLVAGMTIVAAFQDAIDEYYVTASARLLKVVMMTGGIVFGVTIGLYIASRLGVELTTTPERLSLSAINYQYFGAALLAASFALGNQARPIGVVGAGLVGFLALYIVLVLGEVGVGLIPASGIAAAFVGLSATALLGIFRIPTIVTISAGIIPLVPGLTLYSALTHIAQSAPNSPEFDLGVSLLLRAVIIALVIAAGAAFGNLIGRPARRRTIHFNNRLPHWRLHRSIVKPTKDTHSEK